MIYTARLEVYALDSPTHGPVYLPHKFQHVVRSQINRLYVTADLALISDFVLIFVVGYNLGKIFVTLRAVNADGIVSFPFALVAVLRFVLHKNIVNLFSLLHCGYDTVNVSARTIFFALIAIFYIYSEFFQRLLVLFFVVFRKRLAFPVGVGNHTIRHTDIFLEIGSNRRDILRYFSESVEIVPRKHKTSLFALSFKSLYNKKRRRYVSEISYVNRSRRTCACRAQKFLLVGIFADKFFRYSLCPMHNNISSLLIFGVFF